MEDKKYKYIIYIPALFIIGCVLLIWAIPMTSEGYGNRRNLKKKLNENTFSANDISEGRYIYLSDYHVYGEIRQQHFFADCAVFLTTKENNYYIAGINNGRESFAISVQSILPMGLGEKDPFENGIDNTGYSSYKVIGKIEKTDEMALELMEEVVEKHNLNGIFNHTAIMDYKIVLVDEKEEKALMMKGLWILFASVLLIAASKPWKIIQKLEMPIPKSFNYIYEKKYEDKDLRIIGEEAHVLRMNIRCLEKQYSIIQKSAFRSSMWGLIFVFIVFVAPAYFEINILCFVFLIKMLLAWLRLLLNFDLKYSRRIMHLFQCMPLKEKIRIEQEKLERCNSLLDMIYQVVR